ncbi:MAG: prepilin peptidase [Stigonema ocellatum SAG 48.90 = DSM 106950]|nr:prepilin peptidase [Stigonema ocellatum SAG 48.90 = DSM 106950]
MASLIVFTLGASIGSFINVVVYRLPTGLSILWPPSRCPHCLNQLKPYDNLPVLGWLLLKGRCRYCKSKISLRYPVVEAVTGFLFVLVFWIFKFSLFTIGYWVFSSWLLALSLIDLDTMTLPNQLTQSGLVLGILFQMVVGFMLEAAGVGLAKHLMTAIAGAVLGLWLFDAIATVGSIAFGKAVMGGGDAKLAAMMGAWLGIKYLLLAGFIACGVGVLVGGGTIILSRHGSRLNSQRSNTALPQQWGQKMPFGPFLAFGAVMTVFAGEAILSTYLQFFFKRG